MKLFENIKLPSNGLLNNVPKEVTIRALNQGELATIYASLDNAPIEEVLKGILGDQVDVTLLPDEDKIFILHKIREVTFGNNLVQGLRCQFCGYIDNYEVHYEDFKVNYLEPIEPITLSNGDKVKKKVLTKKDHEEAQYLKDKYPSMTKGNLFTMGVAVFIDYIETPKGILKTLLDKYNYLLTTDVNDFVAITEYNITNFGLDTTFIVECTNCKTHFTGGIGLSADIFRKHHLPIQKRVQ